MEISLYSVTKLDKKSSLTRVGYMYKSPYHWTVFIHAWLLISNPMTQHMSFVSLNEVAISTILHSLANMDVMTCVYANAQG